MKKAKIIVPAIALLALGVAGSSLGTVAWFIASQAASYDTVVADTEAVGTKASTLTLGKFTLEAIAGSPSHANVSLTDTSGNSYVYASGTVGQPGTGKVSATAVDPISTISCTLQVSYAAADGEDLPSASDIAQIWKATISANSITIKATSDANVRFLNGNDPAAQGFSWAGTVGTTGVNLTIANSALNSLAFDASGVATSTPSAGSVYVAVTGQEVVEEAASHTVTFTPQNPS